MARLEHKWTTRQNPPSIGLPASGLTLASREQKHEESDRFGGACRVRGRSVDPFGRTMQLPSSADIASASAAQRGALTNSIGKKKGVQSMKIPAPGARD